MIRTDNEDTMKRSTRKFMETLWTMVCWLHSKRNNARQRHSRLWVTGSLIGSRLLWLTQKEDASILKTKVLKLECSIVII